MKDNRLFRILYYILEKGKVTANELADKFEVSVRTIYRGADVLNSLQIMQDFGVNLICVEDGIDSSKEAGKLMISVLSVIPEVVMLIFLIRNLP